MQNLFKERVKTFIVDIRKLDEVKKAVNGVDCVFHIASYGMSGIEMTERQKTREINVTGTQNIITSCCELSVPHLVYTSTYNVVFGGQELVNKGEINKKKRLFYFQMKPNLIFQLTFTPTNTLEPKAWLNKWC